MKNIEKLADKQHEIWSHWMKYMFTRCDFALPNILSAMEEGSCIISREKVERWVKQMNTPYAELTEKEKESDREQARKFTHLI